MHTQTVPTYRPILSQYRVSASREGFVVEIRPGFWDETVVRQDGTTALDLHLTGLVQELRSAAYYLASRDRLQH